MNKGWLIRKEDLGEAGLMIAFRTYKTHMSDTSSLFIYSPAAEPHLQKLFCR
jgi:hypothetical protein